MLGRHLDKVRPQFEWSLPWLFGLAVKCADQLTIEAKGTVHNNQQIEMLVTSVHLLRIYFLSKFFYPLLEISFRNHHIVHIVLYHFLLHLLNLPYSSRSLERVPSQSLYHP